MRRLIRYITRWAWAPVLKEFVLRERRAEAVAQHLAGALSLIAYTPGCIPVQVARRAIKRFKRFKGVEG
jgi:hypothetical protein